MKQDAEARQDRWHIDVETCDLANGDVGKGDVGKGDVLGRAMRLGRCLEAMPWASRAVAALERWEAVFA